MRRALVIPADDEQPMRVEDIQMEGSSVEEAEGQEAIRVEETQAGSAEAEEIEADDTHANTLLRFVGGTAQPTPLARPPASLYVDPDGRLLGKPMNRRATTLLWVHNRERRGRDVVLGDAFVLGPPDDDGTPTNVPEELVNLLLHTSRYRVLVQYEGESRFYGTLRTFGAWVEAYGYAIYIDWLISQVEEVWVVREDGEQLSEDEGM